MNEKWIAVSERLPDEHKPIEWLRPMGGEPTRGERIGNHWVMPDGTWVYYVPVFWRYV